MWGHSILYDLIKWVELEMISTKFDKYGCWSGSTTILLDSRPTMYTDVNHKRDTTVHNIAFSKIRKKCCQFLFDSSASGTISSISTTLKAHLRLNHVGHSVLCDLINW